MKRKTRDRLMGLVESLGGGLIFTSFLFWMVLYALGWEHIKAYTICALVFAGVMLAIDEALDDRTDETTFDDLEAHTFTMRGRR